MDYNRKTDEVKKEIRQIKDEEGVREIVHEVLDHRKMTCPYRDDIKQMKRDTERLYDRELPGIRKMLWGVILMVATVLITAFMNLAITTDNNGLSLGDLILALVNGGK